MQAERLAVQILEDASGVEMEQYRPVAEAMIGRGDVKEILAFLLRTHYAQKPRPAYEADGDDSREARPAREPRAERSERPAPRREERAPRDPAMAAAPRADGPADDDAPLLSPATNLYVTVGLKDGVTDILALAKYLGELSGVDAAHFTGAGAVRDHSSHIEVDNEVADAVIAGCHGKVKPGPQPVRADAPAAEATAPVRDPLAPVMEGDVAAAAEAAPEAPRTIVCERAKSQSSGGSRRRFDGGGRDGRGRDGGGRGRDGGGRGRR